jgi:hypothetical protein
MNRFKDIFVDIAMAASDENSALEFHLILLALDFLLLLIIPIFTVFIVKVIHVVHPTCVIIVLTVIIRHVEFVFFLLLVGDVQPLEDDSLEYSVVVVVVFAVSCSVGNDLN